MKPNWKKGLYRLWLVFAVVWWFVGLVLFLINAAVVFHLTDDIRNFEDWDFLYRFLSLWILTPLVIAGFWKAGVWIIKGFKEEEPPIIEDKEDNKE